MRKRPSPYRTPAIILSVLAAVFLLSALVAIPAWFGSYIRSEEFRGMLADKTGGAFGSKAGFSPIRWEGSSAYSESATLEGLPTSPLKSLAAREIRAEVNWRAAFSGAWRVEDLTIARLDGEWRKPATDATSPTVGPVSSPPGIPPVLAGFLPSRFELGSLTVASAGLRFAGAAIAGTTLTIKPDGRGWMFDGKGGRFTSPWTPDLAITDFRLREQGSDFFLTQGNLRLGTSGKIAVSGESAAGGRLLLSWDGVATSDVLKSEWTRRVQGILSGNATLSAPDVCRGVAVLRDARLENIPLLATVADFTKNPSFRRMPLQEVRGEFAWENGNWRVEKFSAESKGLLKVEGSAVIAKEGDLVGTFQIGVTAQTLQWLPGSRERVFTAARDGYLWTDLKLGGTIEKPTENLSERLMAAMGEQIIETGGEIIKNAPASAVDGVRGVLDMLRPLVP